MKEEKSGKKSRPLPYERAKGRKEETPTKGGI